MTASNIAAPHAFTTRYGGVSRGIYESMNLRSNLGDDISCVRKNYEILYAALGIPEGRTAASKQVHGSTVRVIGRDDCCSPLEELTVEADGMITDVPGIALIIYTADCIPVLLFDPVKNAAAAVHAGWRSTSLGIAGEAVRKMAEVYGSNPADIQAAIGPGIGLECYETDTAVPDAMRRLICGNIDSLIRPCGNKYYVDLKGINRQTLIHAGLSAENIAVSSECTMCLHEKYWSHRYTGGRRGSQASVIMLKGTL